ncbi:hypothetical protein L1987_14741 [Smallanthus sonchifolius]|uniref:Uncharacterized protein n=1 Tax=Smallanthus sonchifolius TaxID=185202 RepID=A0ACB9J4P2_9ASTR|nr:hypothetical protein L1987_14741 [Smallanthus sonchifolius]
MSNRKPPLGIWQETRRQKNGPERGRKTPKATSYFVSNLPEGTKPEDLEECFIQFGKVVDIYVAAKKDKAGGHFGFVRFSGVDDKWALEKAMRGINMKNARLPVNLAKFDKEGNSNNGEERKYQETRFKSYQSNQYGNGELKYKGDRPYLNGVLLNNRIHQHIQDVTVPDDADYDVVQWYDKSVGRKTKDLVELRGLQQSLIREGLADLKLKYLGGLNVFLTFKKYEEANDFVDEKQKWSKIFSELEVFDTIAASIEKVVASSHASFSDGSLTRDTVGVIVEKGGKIQRETNLKRKDKCYKIWCSEDDDVWCPDWSSKETETSVEVEIPTTGVGLGRPEEN